MADEIRVFFPHMSGKDKMSLLGAVYRQSLVQMGYSPDCHVYNLDAERLRRKKPAVAASLLLEVFEYYKSLKKNEADIFQFEALEYGRHYKFWYLTYYDRTTFTRICNRVFESASKKFK